MQIKDGEKFFFRCCFLCLSGERRLHKFMRDDTSNCSIIHTKCLSFSRGNLRVEIRDGTKKSRSCARYFPSWCLSNDRSATKSIVSKVMLGQKCKYFPSNMRESLPRELAMDDFFLPVYLATKSKLICSLSDVWNFVQGNKRERKKKIVLNVFFLSIACFLSFSA